MADLIATLASKTMLSYRVLTSESIIKRARLTDDFCGEHEEEDDEKDEVDRYMDSACEYGTILEYWKHNVELYPNLSKLAQRFLSVPASLASVERAFSLLKRMIGDNRALLKSESISNLMKVHYLLKK
jgi:hypothetical protein